MIMKMSAAPSMIRYRHRGSTLLRLPAMLLPALLIAPGAAGAEEAFPIGGLFLIDDIAEPGILGQHPRAVWNLGNDFAVVWRDNLEGPSFFDCLLRVFDTSGGNASGVSVMNQRLGEEEVRSPDLAPSRSGYLVSFSDDSSNTEGLFDVYVVGADPDGVRVTNQVDPINQLFRDASGNTPRVGGDGDNSLLVAWSDVRFAAATPPNLEDIFARRVLADTTGIDAEDFYVNDLPPDTFSRTPVVVANQAGDHLVVWSDDRVLLDLGGGELRSRFDIYARVVPRTFTLPPPLGTPVHAVSAAEDGFLADAVLPAVAFGDGFFVVAWEDGEDIFARALDADGVPLATEFPVNAPFGEGLAAVQPSVVYFGAGRFAILWRDARDSGSLRVRMYEPRRHVFLSNDVPLLVQVNADAFPAAAASDQARFLATWQGPTDDAHIFGHLFDLRKPGDLNNDTVVDFLDGFRFSETWNPEMVEPVDAVGDMDADGDVDGNDLLILIHSYQADRLPLAKPFAGPRKPLSPEAYGVRSWKVRKGLEDRPERKITRPPRTNERR